MGGGKNPTYPLFFFYIHMQIHDIAIEIARFRKLDCCSELYTLLVDCTPCMTELPAGRVTMHMLPTLSA